VKGEEGRVKKEGLAMTAAFWQVRMDAHGKGVVG
jgi:hypothetical protein